MQNLHIGQNLVLYGGMENSLSEHAATVTFVHKNTVLTGSGRLGNVNIRVFLDSHVQDRVLRAVPVMPTRAQAQDFNARGGGYACYPVGDPNAESETESKTESKSGPELSPESQAILSQELNADLKRLARTYGIAFEEVQ